jgi:hypothetical protein
MRPETIGQDRQLIDGGFAEFHTQLLEGVRNALLALDDGSFLRRRDGRRRQSGATARGVQGKLR